MPRPIRGSIVVVTGASSGIGRATALELARRGATIVVAARGAPALDSVADTCRRCGVDALAVPTDVTDEAAVQRLATRTVDRYGRIDTWVNNAGVSMLAPFEQMRPEAFRRVVETDFFGCVHGARAALPVMRQQGAGVLINTASMLGRVGQPYASAYVAAKFAVRGLSQSLRQELRARRDIHVCTILPAGIDTPFYQHAGNLTGRRLHPPFPTYAPERVARAIADCAIHPRREVMVGDIGLFLHLGQSLSPGLTERAVAFLVERTHLTKDPAPPTTGNLFQPGDPGGISSGGWPQTGEGPLPRVVGVSVAGAAVVFAGWLWLRRAG